jgi:hypothetical protein
MRGDVANPRVTDMKNDPAASPLKQPCERPSEVSYKNPPLHSQFQPGQSGNPKGRPKGSKNVRTILREALQRKYRDARVTKRRLSLRWNGSCMVRCKGRSRGNLGRCVTFETQLPWLTRRACLETMTRPLLRPHSLLRKPSPWRRKAEFGS